MKETLKNIGYISIIPLIICIFFSENIWGYIKFKQYCAAHPQFIINEKLEPNAGWQYSTNEYGHIKDNGAKSIIAENLYFIPQIKFYRFRDYDNRQSVLDGSYVGGKRLPNSMFENRSYRTKDDDEREDSGNYDFKPANFEEKTIYQYVYFKEIVPNSIRLSRIGGRIIDLRTNKIVLETSSVNYRIFDKEIYNYNAGRDSQTIIEIAKHNQIFK
ncbi:MAG: hypothetical protein ACO1N8_09370 [Methylophilus sp.]